MRNTLLLLCVLLTASGATASSAPKAAPSPEEELLALHKAGLDAHLRSDIDALLSDPIMDFLSVNRGELSMRSTEQLRAFLGPYLASTKFEYYRDRVAPVVKVSRDSSLGWVAAQVEARGIRTTADGKKEPLEFVVAWVELYERRDGKWVGIGNASSFKPGD